MNVSKSRSPRPKAKSEKVAGSAPAPCVSAAREAPRDRYARIRALKLPPDEEAKAIKVADKLVAMLVTKRLLRGLTRLIE